MTLFDRFPWLEDLSTSRQEWHGTPPGPNEAGVWGIGNGRVFAHTGMSGPPGSLQGIVGPHHQTEGDHAIEGAFGACWIEVVRDSEPLPVRTGRCGRVRRTAVVVTELGLGDASLRVVDFAPPDLPVLIRHVDCTGILGEHDRIRVRFPTGRPVPDHPRLLSEYRASQVALVAVVSDAEGSVDSAVSASEVDGSAVAATPDGALVVSTALARAGGFSVLIATGTSPRHAEHALQAVGSVPGRLAETRRFWGGWLSGTRAVEPWGLRWDDPRGTARSLADLVESSKISLKLQQSLPGGGAGPMVHFKGTWARDNNGIVRGFLASGAQDEARAAITYYVRASAHLGEIPNRAPLDCPTDVTLPDWSEVPVPPTEVPSWLVLQHYWWLEGGGDLDLVRKHWSFLTRCLDGQALGDRGLLPFHGDETYLHGALLSVYPDRVTGADGLIHHSSAEPMWSLEATAAWATAADAMATMAERLGRPQEARAFRERARRGRASVESEFWQERGGSYAPALHAATGAPHPHPFAPVNAALLWMGYPGESPRRLRRDLAATLEQVGFGRAAPGCPYDVGGTRGMLLRDLLSVGSGSAPVALAHLVRSASPSGDWAEIHGPGGGPDGGYDLVHPNRLRPWETGIALEAIMRYFEIREAGAEPLLEAPLPDRLVARA